MASQQSDDINMAENTNDLNSPIMRQFKGGINLGELTD